MSALPESKYSSRLLLAGVAVLAFAGLIASASPPSYASTPKGSLDASPPSGPPSQLPLPEMSSRSGPGFITRR
jgi:hypothetical protein